MNRFRALALLVGLGAFGLQLARLALSPGHPFDTVWAEDATVFVHDAQVFGWRSIGYSYAGYGHLVPRAIAVVAAEVPLGSLPEVAVLAALAVTGGLVAAAFASARRVLGHAGWAAFAALLIVSVPALREESLGAFCNLQWFLMAATAWRMLDTPNTKGQSIVTAVIVFLTAASTPLVVLVAPILLVRRFVRHPAFWALAAGDVVQVWFVLLAPESVAAIDRTPTVSVRLLRDVALDLVYPAPGALDAGRVRAALAAVLVITSLICCARRLDRRVGLLLVASALVVTVPTVLSGLVQGRYLALATTLLLTAAVVALQGTSSRWAAVWLAVVVAVCACAFPVSARRVSGPSWAAQMRATAAECASRGQASFTVSPVGSELFVSRARLRC